MGNRCLPGGSFRSCRSRSSSLADVQVTALGQPRPPGALPVPRRAEGERGGEGGERRAGQPSGRCRAGDGWSGAAGPGCPAGPGDTALPARVGLPRAGGSALLGFRFLRPDNKLRFANPALDAAPWGLGELRETALPEPA